MLLKLKRLVFTANGSLHDSKVLFMFMLLLLILFSPVSAAPPTPDGATNTSVSAADNGVPIVNIAPQNADGVSRNSFSDFSVDAQGVILNNADNIGVSQLGGAIKGNRNFAAGDGASIILNEVTSNQISNLNGYVETFGKKAEFILANPNGITCDGCGFINTSRATLISGSEQNPTGAVGIFGLGSGTIDVSGAGLNGSNLGFLDIITRAASIQAELSTKNGIAIKTANKNYNFATKTASSDTTTGNGFAIDASLLGSMYAGQIELITTQAGVGVRSLGILEAQQALLIDSAGNIATAALSAGSTITLNAATDITQTGDYLAKNLINLNAATLTLNANVESDQALKIIARDGNLISNGNLKAGTGNSLLSAANGDMTLAGAFYSAGTISLTAVNIVNQNQLAARGSLTINSSGNVNNEAANLIYSARDLLLNIDGTFNNNGDLYAGAKLIAQNQNGTQMLAFINKGGRVESGSDLTIKATKIINSHNFADNSGATSSADTGKITVLMDTPAVQGIATWTEQINPNLKRGLIQSGANMLLDTGVTGSVDNTLSDIYASGNLSINAATINNNAILLREAVMKITSQWVVVDKKCRFAGTGCYDVYGWADRPAQVIQNTSNSIPASIQSAGTLTLKTPAAGVINNSVAIQGNIRDASITGSIADPLANLTLPGEGGFFKPNPVSTKEQPYLIETDPALIDLSKYYGSDYFLKQTGIGSTGDGVLFLGDAYYDQRLVAKQIRLLTGQRYLLNATDDNQQYQQLADAAATERERLGLEIGVALSLEQQQQLQNNILWYVETMVGDKTVLVPRLYLSKATRTQVAKNKAAFIQGQKVALDTGNLMNEGAIISKTALDIKTDDQVNNRGGSLIAGTTLTIKSGGDLISESRWWQTLLGADVRETITQSALIKSGTNMSLDAQGDIQLISGVIDSNGDTNISSAEDLDLVALQLASKRNWRDSNGNWNYTNNKLELATTKLKSKGNLVLSSLGNMLLQSSDIETEANATIDVAGSFNMVALQTIDSTSGIKKTKKMWSTTTNRSQKTTKYFLQANLTANGNINITSETGTTVFGSSIKSDVDINLHSNSGNINLIAAVDTDFEQQQFNKKGFSYQKKTDNGIVKQSLNSSVVNSGGDLSLTTGTKNQGGDKDKQFGNIIVSGSVLSSVGNMTFGNTILEKTTNARQTLTADTSYRINNLLFDTVAVKNKTWNFSQKNARGLGVVGKLFTGGELLRVDALTKQQLEQRGSDAKAGGSLLVKTTGKIQLRGATLEAKGFGKFDALDDIEVISAINRSTEDKVNVLATANGISFDWDGSRVSVGINADYKKSVINQEKYTNKSSVLNFDGDLSLLSEKNILLSASTLKTSGSLTVAAKKALSVMSADDILKRADSLTKAQARASVGVGNVYLDFAQSLARLNAAKKKVRQAKRDLAAFNKEIAQMQADLKKGLVTNDDIRLRKRDKKYYIANVALAAANLVNSAVQVTAAGSATGIGASTSVGTGFYVDVKFEVNGSKTKKITDRTQSIASNLIAENNMSLTATDDITIRGSNIRAQNNISINSGNTVLIEAALNENNSTTKRNAFNASMSFGTNGVKGGPKNIAKIFSVGKQSFGLGASNGFDRRTSTTWNNSTIVAGKKFKINSNQDTDIVGATVQAEDIALSIGGNFVVQSRQSKINSRGNDFGIKVGSTSSGLNIARRNQDKRWVDNITRLIGSKLISIETKGKTSLVGAVIAQIDKNGVDGGNLTLKTTSFESKDLIDFDRSSNFKLNISSSLFGVNKLFPKNKNKTESAKISKEVSTKSQSKPKISKFYKDKSSLKLSNSGYVRGQNILATLGKGKLSSWDNKPILLASLNRDINSLQIVTANRKTGGLNVDVSIDHRMLSKKGWKDIAKDTKATIKNIRDISKSISTVSKDKRYGIQNLGQVIKTNIINTKLDDILSRKNNKLLKAIKSKNPEQSLKSLRQFARIVQNELGISLNKILFYDSNKTSSSSLKKLTILGAYITGKSKQKGNIFINTGGILSKKIMIKTLLHEIYEQEYAAGRSYLLFKTKYKKKEDLADFSGDNFISRLNKKTVMALENTSQQERSDIRNSKEVSYGTLMANQVGDAEIEYRRLHIKEIKLIDKRAVDFAKILNRLPRYRLSTGRHDGRPRLRPTKNHPVLPPTKVEIIEAKRRLYKAALRAVSGDYQYQYKQFYIDLQANKFLNALSREKIRSGRPTVNGKLYPLYARSGQITLAEQINQKATEGVVWFQSTPWQRFNSSYKNTFGDDYFSVVKGIGLNIENLLTGKGFEFEFPEYQLKPVVKQAYDLINSGKNYGVYQLDLTQENRAGKKRVMQSNAAKDSIILAATAYFAGPFIAAVIRSSFGASVRYAARYPITACRVNTAGCRELFEFGIGFIPDVVYFGLPSSGLNIKASKNKIPKSEVSTGKARNYTSEQSVLRGTGALSQLFKVFNNKILTAKIIKVSDKIFNELNNSNDEKKYNELDINNKRLDFSFKNTIPKKTNRFKIDTDFKIKKLLLTPKLNKKKNTTLNTRLNNNSFGSINKKNIFNLNDESQGIDSIMPAISIHVSDSSKKFSFTTKPKLLNRFIYSDDYGNRIIQVDKAVKLMMNQLK